jgi:hypothetical protein
MCAARAQSSADNDIGDIVYLLGIDRTSLACLQALKISPFAQ